MIKIPIKKLLWALTVFSLSACSNDPDPEPSQTQYPVCFSARAQSADLTRGLSINSTADLGKYGFGIMAYHKEEAWNAAGDMQNKGVPNFMNNQLVTNDGSNWVYTPLRYWPTTAGKSVSFFAYAPYEEEIYYGQSHNIRITPTIFDAAAVPSLHYTLPSNPKDMVDLKVDFKTVNIPEKKSKGWNAVAFNFQNALCKVDIKAKVGQNVYAVIFKSMRIVAGAQIQQVFDDGTSKTYNNRFHLGGQGGFVEKTGSTPDWLWRWENFTEPVSDYSLNWIMPIEHLNKAIIEEQLKLKNIDVLDGYESDGVLVTVKSAANQAQRLFKDNDGKDKDYLFLFPANSYDVTSGNIEDSALKPSAAESTGDAICLKFTYDLLFDYESDPSKKLFRLSKDLEGALVITKGLRQGAGYSYIMTFNNNGLANSTMIEFDHKSGGDNEHSFGGGNGGYEDNVEGGGSEVYPLP